MSLEFFASESSLPIVAPDNSQFHRSGLLSPHSLDLWDVKLGKSTGASSGSEIAFIDQSVTNYQSLIDGINPGTQVVVLDSHRDGVQQISDALTGNYFSAVHIISHGSSGGLQLGASYVNNDSLTNYAGAMQQWKDYLSADADILLYGCNVAAGEQGEAFVKQLSQLTDADVAASNDLTGSAALGGDWLLESATGEVEAPSAFQASALKNYHDIFASSSVVISQVYGGGGSTNSSYKNDYIELFNRGNTTVDLSTWSVQYASASGSTWSKTNLTGLIAPNSYYLVQQSGGLNGTSLPTPDLSPQTPLSMSSTTGKVALVNNTTLLSGTAPTGSSIIDRISYGSAATGAEGSPTTDLNITTAAIRKAGNADTDNNLTDFVVGTPIPRNSSYPVATVAAGTTPVENTSTNGSFTINLNKAAPTGGLTLNFNNTDSTAIGGGKDYTLVGGTNITSVGANSFTIAAGATSATLTVQMVNDTAAEADETVKLNLTSGGTSYGLGTTGSETATLTIAANDTEVVNTNDIGEGSLRQAILNANAFAGTDTISFNIPTTDPNYNASTGAFTITPTSALPTITGAVVMDGTTQPGFSTTPLIELNGDNAFTAAYGLNLVSGSDGSTIQGLVINGFRTGIAVSSNGNFIKGNYIGTDVTGTVGLNGSIGVLIEYAANNTVGGTTTAERNLISSNEAGVIIQGSSATNNSIKGNYIGTDITGTVDLGNRYSGVQIYDAANNIVGGTTTAEGNLISGNELDGVTVIGEDSTGNRILGNSIFANGELGINLNYDGITTNDANDPDTGANKLQNFPTFTSASISGATVNLTYKVDSSTTNSTYPLRVEFFLSDGGEGKTFLGADNYTTANTDKTFSFTPTATVNQGDKIVATVTDSDGNTSEFSLEQVVALLNTPPVLDLNGATAGIDYNTTFTRNQEAVAIVNSNNLSLTDDNLSLASATVTITNLLDGANESLSVDTTPNISASYSNGILSLTGNDSIANYQQVLQSVKYNNTATIPKTTARTISFVVNDGSANSDLATSTVAINVPTTSPGSGSTNITPGIQYRPTASVSNTTPDTLYPFKLTTATQVVANLAMNSGNADMELLDSNGTVLASSTNSGTLTENLSRSGLTPGDYFIRVYQAQSGEVPNYRLSLKFA